MYTAILTYIYILSFLVIFIYTVLTFLGGIQYLKVQCTGANIDVYVVEISDLTDKVLSLTLLYVL